MEIARLTRVEIGGFQSYGPVQSIDIDSSMTLLVGRNDVGKSALFRALDYAVHPRGQTAPDGLRLALTLCVPTARWSAIASGSEELAPLTSALAVRQNFGLRVAVYPTPGPPNTGAEKLVRSLTLRVEGESWTAGNGESDSSQPFIWTSGPLAGTHSGWDALTRIFADFAQTLLFVSPKRSASSQGRFYQSSLRIQRHLDQDGSNVADVLSTLRLNDTPGYDRIQDVLRDAFPRVAEVAPAAVEDDAMSHNPQVFPQVRYRDGTRLPLQDCGTGIEELTILATAIFSVSDGRIICADEPGTHLHGSAQRSLLDSMVKHREHQYILAGQSTFFQSHVPLTQARLLTLDGNAHTAIHPSPDSARLLAELGVTAAQLYQPEAILWVEGPSDEAIVSTVCADMIERGLRVAALPFVSSFLQRKGSSRHAAYSLVEIIKATCSAPVTSPTCYLFDRDEKSGESRAQMGAASNGQAVFLLRREIENYLLVPSWIADALKEGRALLGLGGRAPTTAKVAKAMNAVLARTDDERLYPGSGTDPVKDVKGSEVLDRLFGEFASSGYDKVVDGRRLAEIGASRDLGAFNDIRSLALQLLDPAGGPATRRGGRGCNPVGSTDRSREGDDPS